MEQIIAKLEAEVDQLIEKLKAANEEITKLKKEGMKTLDSSASMDLLKNMESRSTEDQLQLYIEDSLDLLIPAETIKNAASKSDVEDQLSFDLLHSLAETSITITTTEQTDYMTIQQLELNGLPDVLDETQVAETVTTDVQPASESTQEAATLTPEQKKRQKNQKNNRRLIKMLEDRYPKAFDWNQPKPLKVGIDKDMVLDDDFNVSKQKRALAAYTRSDRYKKCLLTGQPRIDLEGTPVSNEPALPDSMIPKKEKATFNRPKSEKPQRPKAKPQANNRASQKPNNKPNNKPQNTQTAKKRQDEAYDNLSPEERMKAKLERLLNK